MNDVRSNVAEGLQHKAAQVHTRMRQGQLRGVDDLLSVEDEVYVDRAAGVDAFFGRGAAEVTFSAQLGLDGEAFAEGFERGERGANLESLVEEALDFFTFGKGAPGLGLIDG